MKKCSLNLKAFNYTLLHFLSRFAIIQNAVLVEMEEIKNTKNFDSNPLTTKSDQHLISPYNITCESHIKVWENKGNGHQLKMVLIVKQILLIST